MTALIISFPNAVSWFLGIVNNLPFSFGQYFKFAFWLIAGMDIFVFVIRHFKA